MHSIQRENVVLHLSPRSLPPFLALSVCVCVFQNLCWQNYENHYTLHWLNCERCFTSHAAWTRRCVWNETTTPWCKPPAYPNSFFMQSNCHAVFAGAESLYNWILIKFIFSYLGRGDQKETKCAHRLKDASGWPVGFCKRVFLLWCIISIFIHDTVFLPPRPNT